MQILTVTLCLTTCIFCAADDWVTIVQSSHARPYQDAANALQRELIRFGHKKSKSRVVELNTLLEEKHRLQSVPGDSVFVAVGTKAALYLGKHLPSTSQFTYCMVANADQLKASGAIRGAGVTTDIPPKVQFQLISEAIPRTRSIGMLYRSGRQEVPEIVISVQEVLPDGWSLKLINISEYDSVSAAIKSLCKQDIDVVWTQSDISLYTPAVIRSLLLTSLRERIPIFGFSIPFVKAGALLGMGINPLNQGRETAQIVLTLLERDANQSGSAESVRIPKLVSEFEFAVNLIVAENLSIKIATSIIEKATYVYKTN